MHINGTDQIMNDSITHRQLMLHLRIKSVLKFFWLNEPELDFNALSIMIPLCYNERIVNSYTDSIDMKNFIRNAIEEDGIVVTRRYR